MHTFRGEGVEVVGAHLGGTVASPQVVLEEDGDLLHARASLLIDGSSHLQGGNEVLLAVGAHLADGQLRAGDDDGLAQVLEHETQGRCREGHRVGAMQHDKAVVEVVALLDGQRDVAPVRGVHVAAVDRRFELEMFNLVVQFLDLGHIVDEVVKVERLQGMGLGILDHADGAAGIDNEYFGSFHS